MEGAIASKGGLGETHGCGVVAVGQGLGFFAEVFGTVRTLRLSTGAVGIGTIKAVRTRAFVPKAAQIGAIGHPVIRLHHHGKIFVRIVAAVKVGGLARIDETGRANTQALCAEQATRKARGAIRAFFTKLSTDINGFVAGA